MDAALIGALIGISIMVGFGIGMKIYDLYQERKRPIMATKGTPLFVRRHSKMNTLFPK